MTVTMLMIWLAVLDAGGALGVVEGAGGGRAAERGQGLGH